MGDFPLPSICPTSSNIIKFINSFCVHINIHMYILRYFCKYNECKKILGKGTVKYNYKERNKCILLFFLRLWVYHPHFYILTLDFVPSSFLFKYRYVSIVNINAPNQHGPSLFNSCTGSVLR